MRKIMILVSFCVACIFTIPQFVVRGSADSAKSITVTFEGKKYAGKYAGEMSDDGEPNGEGMFTSSDSGKLVTVEGTWNNGILQGSVRITLSDSSIVVVDYQDDVENGIARRTYDNGDYSIYRCDRGKHVNKVMCFDRDGQLKGIDRYYDEVLISDLIEQSEEVNYSDLFTQSVEYFMKPIKFSGRVTDVLDNSKGTYILVENEENETIIGNYYNTETATPQALVPNLSVGENVTLYGFYKEYKVLNTEKLINSVSACQITDRVIQVEEYSVSMDYPSLPLAVNNTAIYSSLPMVSVFYAEPENDSKPVFSEIAVTEAQKYDYNVLNRFPYYFSYFEVKDIAVIVKETVKNNRVTMILQKDDSNQLYYASYTLKEGESLPHVNEKVVFKGTVGGNYKLKCINEHDGYCESTYVLIPKLEISSIG